MTSYSVCVGGARGWCPVGSVEDASREVRARIEAAGMGSREWYGLDNSIGRVLFGRVHVSTVSYNGTVRDAYGRAWTEGGAR